MSNVDPSSKPWARFGPRLVAARLAAGFTQLALAQRCGGRSNSWIVQLEAGTNALPRMDDVMTLAIALGVPPEWLLFGKTFGSASDRRIALGVGGPDAEIDTRRRDAELKLYAGSWEAAGDVPGADALLCSCSRDDAWASHSKPRLFLLDQRGRRLLARGFLNADGEVVDAAGEPAVATRRYRVAGVCWPAPV